MSPCFVFANPADGGNAHSEFLRYLFECPSSFPQGSHSEDIIFLDLSRMMFGTWPGRGLEHSIRMKLVLAWSHGFEIFRSIVSLFTVLMINLFSFWHRTMESLKYQAMYREFPFGFITEKSDATVSILGSFKTAKTVWLGLTSICPRANSFYFSMVADFVQTLVSEDRFPILAHTSTIPLTEVRLNGEIRLS